MFHSTRVYPCFQKTGRQINVGEEKNRANASTTFLIYVASEQYQQHCVWISRAHPQTTQPLIELLSGAIKKSTDRIQVATTRKDSFGPMLRDRQENHIWTCSRGPARRTEKKNIGKQKTSPQNRKIKTTETVASRNAFGAIFSHRHTTHTRVKTAPSQSKLYTQKKIYDPPRMFLFEIIQINANVLE